MGVGRYLVVSFVFNLKWCTSAMFLAVAIPSESEINCFSANKKLLNNVFVQLVG